jgi:phosphomannomutase
MFTMSELTCFKAYDIRGELGIDIDTQIAYRIGRAVAQHFNAKSVVVGRDARETSPEFADAVSSGIMDAGADVLDIGLSGTEEMYWAVTEFKADAGIIVTASHNPINYNGMKIVKSASRPLDDEVDFKVIKKLSEDEAWSKNNSNGTRSDIAEKARVKYVKQVVSFIETKKIKPLKIVVNCGNGAAGPTFDAIAKSLLEEGAPLEFIRVHHEPDDTFPNGIPNPLLVENRPATANAVISEGADLGVAFDGDFDRCFFFDETGAFIGGEYVLSLLATSFLDKNPGSNIIHDPRVIWNVQDIVTSKGGKAIQSKTGHAFIKQAMRQTEAIYGGEMSAHHYFKDFAYCDSGMVPWLLIMELLSTSGMPLSALVKSQFEAFPSSGENNFTVEDADVAIETVLQKYKPDALSIDDTDGVSLSFDNWRFNLRKSNNEPLVRLNIEARGNAVDINQKLEDIKSLIT